MKIYMVLEVQNTGGVPPDKEKLAAELGQRIKDVPADQMTASDQLSQNEIVRTNILEVEV